MIPADIPALLAELRRVGNDHFRCEVKRSQGGPPATLWESISAFANAQGGCILLGIDERSGFTVVGVNDAGAMESHLGAVCSEMEPTVRAEIFTATVDDKNVVACYVPPTPRDQRPCHRRSLGPWAGSRIRVADGDRKLTDYEVAILLANRTEQKYDVRAVPGSSFADLDQKAVSRFLGRIRETKGELFRKVDDERALTMLNVLTVHDGDLVPTLAGLLAFGIYPQTFEPQLNLTFVAYSGTEPGTLGPAGERFIENRSVDGSIPFIVNECVRVLKRNMKRRSIVSGIFRIDEWEYPEEVLREALVNALVHRDYSDFARGMQVQVEMYPDRLVIRNPGGLYGPVDVGALGTTTVTSSRNKALLKILEDTPHFDGHMVCENRGSGITRIRIVLTEAGMEPPEFIDGVSSFTVEFPNHALLDQDAIEWLQSLDNRPLSRSQMTALVMMRNGAVLTNGTYRASTGVQDSRTVSRELRDLVERGLIEQQGTRGTTTYRHSDGRTFEQEEDLFTLTRLDDRDAEGSASTADAPTTEELVLSVMSRTELSRTDIEQQTGLRGHQVLRALQSLRDRGLVRMIGRPRSRSARYVATSPAPAPTERS
ncbi:ATP-binding protein [Phytohabitans sp. ZYX-F-186]|uniref:ATP-binding protein n=1 Tax=Phytohabitans maris TaxID=3071409 RepID=A0ABU0ZIG0_9ACTN|nr:ATP-binding protein [Phytohabitans sp. ZYX-F-186]MDQ7906844.1 ATP-binding protein [Phytohabitans sp. ZYX-F-186]